MHAPSRLHRIPAAALFILAIACGSDSALAPTPTPRGSIAIAMDSANVYAGDDVALHAVVRDAEGHDVPAPAVTWSASDTTVAELSATGVLSAIRPGTVRISAHAGDLTTAIDLTIRPLSVLSVAILGLPDTLGHGDVIPFGVRITGEGGRIVTGRAVTLRSVNPAIATIDPSGRLRTVSAGRTEVTATVDGVTTTRAIVVEAASTILPLRDIDGGRLPLLVASDSVTWDGVRELAEVYVESGSLQLTGGPTPRYATVIRSAQYAVTRLPDGRKNLQLRARFAERDFGLVEYDARGELVMTSEYISPVSHTASAAPTGIAMRYRIPGDDTILSLFFRREPK
jgi:hypothetical protein